MIDINFTSKGNTFEFKMDKYNQILIANGERLHFSFFERLNDLNAIKYDDYLDTLYDSNIRINGKNINKKDILFIDFSNSDSILRNFSFDKNSIIRKNYISNLTNNLEEENYENLIKEANILISDKSVELVSKEPNIEKVFDLFFEASDKNISSLLLDFNQYIKHILRYKEINDSVQIIILIDSSHKTLNISELLEVEGLYIMDKNINVNTKSKNYILFSDEVTTFEFNNLVDRLNMNWPAEVDNKEITTLLQSYFAIIINNNITELQYISDESSVLYVLLRKIFNLELSNINVSLEQCKNEIYMKFMEELGII